MAKDKEKEFAEKYCVDIEELNSSKSSAEDLSAIAEDYIERMPELKNSAEFFANALQSIPCVHSVRWRTKDPKHLIKKIIRKRLQGSEKYKSISVSNYREIVTDLIGVRAIHLFKEDLWEIDEKIRSRWEVKETPIIYIRKGDQENVEISGDHEIKTHDAGYRSAHYLIESKPTRDTVVAELQVRTIFEEGWSEIDHTLRYPDHSEDKDLQSVLTLFNRIAGSADEIASFTLNLKKSVEKTSAAISQYRQEAEEYKKERDTSFEKISGLLKQLNEQKSKGNGRHDLISKLQEEMDSMKKIDPVITPLSSFSAPQKSDSNQAGLFLAAIAAIALLSKK